MNSRPVLPLPWRQSMSSRPVLPRPWRPSMNSRPVLPLPWRQSMSSRPVLPLPWRQSMSSRPVLPRPWRPSMNSRPVLPRPWRPSVIPRPAMSRYGGHLGFPVLPWHGYEGRLWFPDLLCHGSWDREGSLFVVCLYSPCVVCLCSLCFSPDPRLSHGSLPGSRSYPGLVVSSPVRSALGAPVPSAPPGGLQSRLLRLGGLQVRLLHPGGSQSRLLRPGGLQVRLPPPWRAPVPSAPPWLPHGPGPPSLPLFRLRSTAHLVMCRSIWKPLLGGGLCHESKPWTLLHSPPEVTLTSLTLTQFHITLLDYISHHSLHPHSCFTLSRCTCSQSSHHTHTT